MVDDGFRQEIEAGAAAHAAGRPDLAVLHFARAVKLSPRHPVALFNLGIALEDAGREDAALPVLEEAWRLRPDHIHTLFRLGSLLARQGRHEAAAVLLSRLLAHQPDFPDAAFRLGNVLMALGRYAAAERAYRLAMILAPDAGSVVNNLGGALRRQGRAPEAARWYQRAVRLAPLVAEYHKNLGVCLITLGDWREGWPHYDWRNRQTVWGWRRELPGVPLWDGSPLAGRTILVHFEQGLGDTLQFIRYLSVLKRQGARTVFECQPTMRDILHCVPDIDQLVCHGEPLPPVDCHAPLMSLPGLCGDTPETVPGADLPYLHPPADRVAAWGRRIGMDGFKVGINWRAAGDDRSMPLAAFAPLAAVPGVRLFNLQQDVGLDQLDHLAGPFGITRFPDAERERTFGSFVDSAAIIANLDLVISCDSAMIHLAGAMGRPAFLALPWLADWRWLTHPDRTVWYDCVRMFRSEQEGDWESVAVRIANAVVDLINLKVTGPR
ncbi:tetratricopeptide repeat protein [Niveispirillum sp.]|uniref:tetratricopeptide repeat protein n=1 Tax=Niveispirillum sp. TaxID=1917217 RepID=UPI001B6EC441|nr:tetratricopeptide repeat protein [Niveispirillum sp.]MBP7340048.1 tetratricopeptide repeat protein [Niveispirillum sp.]